MILFLDDCPIRTRIFMEKYPSALSSMSPTTIIALIKQAVSTGTPIQYLFLDHDLAGDQDGHDRSIVDGTGMQVVRWLEENPTRIGQVIVHSHNVVAAPVMYDRLKRANYYTIMCPFFQLVPQLGR